MPCCLLALGSNQGNREKYFNDALQRIAAHPEIHLVRQSRWRETLPVGTPTRQDPYLNGAAIVETTLAPLALLAFLQEIEQGLGRRREERWGARTIDLDLLLYDDRVLHSPELELPHPRMAWRRFVLEPAAEIAGSMIHPVIGWSLQRLLEHLNTAFPYLAVTGPLGVGKTALVERCCREKSARALWDRPDLSEKTPSTSVFREESDRLEWGAEDPSSSGHFRAIELKFLECRGRILALEGPMATESRLAMSDFWFEQSVAYARVQLDPKSFEEFVRRFETLRRSVVRPKLLILWDLPTEFLVERIRRRDCPQEASWTVEHIEAIRRSILQQVEQPDLGPVLKLNTPSLDEAYREVSAAVDAMV